MAAATDTPTVNEVLVQAKPTPQSSWINWVGWAKTEGAELLILDTANGTRFAFLGVTRQRAQSMARAKSPGKYFYRNIRGKYPFLRLLVEEKGQS